MGNWYGKWGCNCRQVSYNSKVFGRFDLMVTCPACEGNIDVDEEDVDEGDSISCDECGAVLKVAGTDPLELESAEEADEDEEDEDGFVEEEEEESEEDWR
jgi:alpha-aminoadipate carrier protein LysW